MLTHLFQETGRTPNPVVLLTPKTTVHLMDVESQEPIKSSKAEEDRILNQDQVQEEEFHYTGRRIEQRSLPPRINFATKPTT